MFKQFALGVFLVAVTATSAPAAIFLSLDGPSGVLFFGDSATFTVNLNVTSALPDPTSPPDSTPTPLSNMNFEVLTSSVDGGLLTVTSAAIDGAITAVGTGSETLLGSSAQFNWSGNFSLPSVAGGVVIPLATFTVQAASISGTIDISLQELVAGNNPGPTGTITSDFIFQSPSEPIGGDDQLFGTAGGINNTGSLGSITAVPEPSSLALLALGSVVCFRRRR